MVFMDLFHGSEKSLIDASKFLQTSSKVERQNVPTYNWLMYFIVFILCLLWAVFIPIARVSLGAHSIDQCLFGSILGIWSAITCHFIVRDHLINHIIRATRIKRAYL